MSVQAGSSRPNSLIEPSENEPVGENHEDPVSNPLENGPQARQTIPASNASDLNHVGANDLLMATFSSTDAEIEKDFAAILEASMSDGRR